METIKAHIPCGLCGSSDAATHYKDTKGKEFIHCFSCKGTIQLSNPDVVVVNEVSDKIGSIRAVPERDITKDTAQFYGVYQTEDAYRFAYPGGYKVRLKREKKFMTEGTPTGLFGQDKFPGGGKYVTIVEGEFDALAAFQILGSRYPVVSIRRGAGTAFKDVSEAYEWLDTFEKVVICFDNDPAGQENAKKVAELFAHKALVVKLTKYKDANEYLMQQENKEFVDAWWKAEKVTLDGIVQGSTLWGKLREPKPQAVVQYPFAGLNGLTYGIRKGELVMVTSGSGMGKSQFLREVTWQILNKTKDNVGLMFLEENNEKTALGLMSLAANKPLHLPDSEYTEQEYADAFKATMGTDRVYLFDHFGSSSIDNIISRVRYLARGCGCGFILLDHISIVVSGQENGDERKALDEVMTKLRTVVQETGISLICVSHLKRPEGKGHEEGAATSLAQLRGSGAIAQLSDIVIGLERNGQAEDLEERNTTKLRVLKNRFCGLTGPCGEALYNRENGRMFDKQEMAL